MTAAVERLRQLLAAHTPFDAREAVARRRILGLLSWLPRPFDEAADPTHVTASAIVLDADRRVLLHRHKRLGIWLQPGGHLDAGEEPAAAAVRETREETGLVAGHPPAGPLLLHVDVHEGPRAHVHLDLRYLLVADGAAALRPAADESPEVRWTALADALTGVDPGLATALRRAATLP